MSTTTVTAVTAGRIKPGMIIPDCGEVATVTNKVRYAYARDVRRPVGVDVIVTMTDASPITVFSMDQHATLDVEVATEPENDAQHAAWAACMDETRPGSDTSWTAYRAAMEDDEVADQASPAYVQLRAMKGQARKVMAASLVEGQAVRVDGVKYRVQGEPEVHPITGTVLVPVYNEDNQHDMLYLSAAEPLAILIGAIR